MMNLEVCGNSSKYQAIMVVGACEDSVLKRLLLEFKD